MFERTGKLVGKKFVSYLMVNVLIMMAASFSSIINGIIASNELGTDSLAAINACVPFVVLFGALYMIIGVGGSLLSASKMGAGKTKEANSAFTLSVISLVLVGLLVMVVLLITRQPLVTYITGGSDLYGLTMDYLSIIALGAVPLFIGPGISYFMILDGRPDLSMGLMLIYSGGNVVLALLFMGPLELGIKGAAAATVLAATLSLICVVLYFVSKTRTLRFSLKDIQLGMIPTLLVVGLPSALNSVVLFIRILVLNKTAFLMLGNAGATAISVCNNCSTFSAIFITGITTTMLTVLSVLYGEEDSRGLKEVFIKASKLVAVASVIMLIVFELMTGAVLTVFGIKDEYLWNLGLISVRLFGLSLPLYAIAHIFMSFYQAIGRKWYAICLVVCEGVIFMLPLVFFLSRAFPENGLGLWLSFTFAEVMTLLFLVVVNTVIAKRKGLSGVLLLKKHDDNVLFDKTIDNDIESASKLSAEIVAFCNEHGIDNNRAVKTGLAVEEMSVNTINYGYKKDTRSVIDIRIIITPEKDITIRIRDNGALFNPLEYNLEESDQMGGIYILHKMTKSIGYSRSIGFNSLVIKL